MVDNELCHVRTEEDLTGTEITQKQLRRMSRFGRFFLDVRGRGERAIFFYLFFFCTQFYFSDQQSKAGIWK
jgi:hypothetical protein